MMANADVFVVYAGGRSVSRMAKWQDATNRRPAATKNEPDHALQPAVPTPKSVEP
ncbi:hypothetical protein DPV78_011979 [Talaromyces pinophilus]|nr:hypothetical protein DPV78_011979 [Talaromyces pinophilus]